MLVVSYQQFIRASVRYGKDWQGGRLLKGYSLMVRGGMGGGGGRKCLLVTSLIDNNFCLFYIYFQPF